jgi:protein-disulfide isomerase
MNRRTLVLGVTAVALAGFGGATYFVTRGKNPETVAAEAENTPLIRSYSPILGPTDAPVTIVEFFDPACEACRAFHPIVKQIKEAFPGKVRLVLRYAAFHPPSEEAIKILETARLQDLFLPILESLLEAQPRWAPHGRKPESVWDVAARAGLDVERARVDAKMPDIVAILIQDAADVKTVGVRRTPTFFVNGKPLTDFGAQQLFNLVKSEVEATGGITKN